MNRWPLQQVFALLLAVFVATGMGLSVIRANDMALKMAIASDMGAAAHYGCQDCPGAASKDGAKATSCVTACAAPVVATCRDAALQLILPTAAAICPANVAVLHGRPTQPDPHPPRTSDIG